MKKYIALRMRNLRDAKLAVKHHNAVLVRTLSSSMEPALRNVVEGLHKRGLAIDVDGCGLHWLLIDDNHDCDYYNSFNEVEICFDSDWFEAQKDRIRYLSGLEYCEACEKLAEGWELKDSQRKIAYKLPEELLMAY